MKKLVYVALVVITAFFSCTNETQDHGPVDTTPKTPPKPRVKGPAFSADSAYNSIKTQVDFGPRVPGTPAHDACAKWYVEKFKALGLEVASSGFPGHLPITGKDVQLQNIFASFHKERKERIQIGRASCRERV